MRSFSARTTERLSLSDAAPGRCSSMRTIPTNMAVRPSALGAPRRLSSQRAGELLDGERLDDVSHLEVVHAVEADAALEPARDLAHVLLEAPERADPPDPHRGPVAHQPHPRGARHAPRRHHA